ncbi:isochorismatase family protein [Flexivirga sp. B27]
MTALTDRPQTALLVIDVQQGVLASAHRRDDVVNNVKSLVDRARAEQVPVIWVQHHDDQLEQGSADWQLVAELSRDDSEQLVEKSFGDSFEGTDLEDVLAASRIGHLVVAGAATDMCVRSTIHGAFARGYDVTLVGDAHTTEDLSAYGAPSPELVISHTNLYWRFQSGPGKFAATVNTADVSFTAPRG